MRRRSCPKDRGSSFLNIISNIFLPLYPSGALALDELEDLGFGDIVDVSGDGVLDGRCCGAEFEGICGGHL